MFNAAILDQEFRDRVEIGAVTFGSGDTMRLRIRRRTVRHEDSLRTSFEVVRVIQHHPAPRQDSLLHVQNKDES